MRCAGMRRPPSLLSQRARSPMTRLRGRPGHVNPPGPASHQGSVAQPPDELPLPGLEPGKLRQATAVPRPNFNLSSCECVGSLGNRFAHLVNRGSKFSSQGMPTAVERG